MDSSANENEDDMDQEMPASDNEEEETEEDVIGNISHFIYNSNQGWT